MSEHKRTIFQAIANVMRDVPAVAKDQRNQAQNFNFRGIDSVLNAVGPKLREHGVMIQPQVKDLRYELVPTSNSKRAVQVLAFVDYTFWDVHGDHLTVSVVGEAMDYGDKGVSKAMSVALRTALLQTLALPTDEPDPDHDVYERAEQPAQRQHAHAAPRRRNPVSANEAATKPQLGAIYRLAGALDMSREDALGYVSQTVGRRVSSSTELTKAEASTVIDKLSGMLGMVEKAEASAPADDVAWPEPATPADTSAEEVSA